MIGGGGINTKAIADELLFLFFFYLVIAPVNIFFLDVVSARSSFVVSQSDRFFLTFLWLVKRFRLLWQNRVDAPLITRSCVSHCFQLTVQTCHKTQHLHNLSHTHVINTGEGGNSYYYCYLTGLSSFLFLISSDFKERKREELWRNYAAEFDDVVPPTDTTNRSRRPFNNTWRLYMCPQVVVRLAGYNHCLLFK